MDEHGMPHEKYDPEPLNHATTPPKTGIQLWLKWLKGRRPLHWLGVVGTGVMIGVLVAVVTGWLPLPGHSQSGRDGMSASSPSIKAPVPATTTKRPSATTSSGPSSPNAAHSAPLRPLHVVSRNPLDDAVQKTWVFPPGLAPSPTQMAQVDEDRHYPPLVNRDFFNDGGYPPATNTQIIVRNTRPYTVLVTNIGLSVSCHAPVERAIADGQDEPADAAGEIGFVVDAADPQAMVATGPDPRQWKGTYFDGRTDPIPAGGLYTFNIQTVALHRSCSFWFVVTVVDGNNTITQMIGDYAQPFRVSALVLGKRGHRFIHYDELYVGGATSPFRDGTWVRENPQTWAGRRDHSG